MSRLRGFQTAADNAIVKAWDDGARCVMPVLPTGSGKTVLMGHRAHEHDGLGCAIAHRSELVGQISIALAKEEVRHNILAPKAVIRTIVGAQMEEIGYSYYDPRAKWTVASVDTILRRELDAQWQKNVTLVFEDEGHHVLRDNKWGRAFLMFPNARGLFPTATPLRADGRGLGSHADGLVDTLVEGPGMRWLIDQGYLTDYRVLVPHPSDLDMAGVEISSTTGDYNADQMRKRVKASTTIIGDVVQTYLRHTNGLRGICFAVDIEHAGEIAKAFNAVGVPAQVVHADTPEAERRDYMRKLRSGELRMLVNVDLFGEGVDVPAVQVVIMARPTMSYGLFVQQFGRALRLLLEPMLLNNWDAYTPEQRLRMIAQSDKPLAHIHDHVGNVIVHGGPPDMRRFAWSLDARSRRSKAADGIPLRACCNPTCLQAFERIYPTCPYCGWIPPAPSAPTRPEHVDGDLILYTPEMFAELSKAKQAIDSSHVALPYNCSDQLRHILQSHHRNNQQSQMALREAMRLMLPPGFDERIANRRFFHTFGIDTLTAQGLKSSDALDLRQRILERIRQ